jgi:tRNA threonylcarbamoyladenosine biosynthesis protein TsaE
MLRIATDSPEATLEIARRVGTRLRAGDVVLLRGRLGAGKTQFVKGLARGLGIDSLVTSPTFTLLQVYPGLVPMYHFDLYRLQHSAELAGIGFDEYLEGDGVSVVEWPDLFPDAMPSECLWIDIETGESPEERVFWLHPFGSSYEERFDGRDDI